MLSLLITSQEDQTFIEVDIDPRVHRRLIGARGASIRRVMERFNVDIRFPRPDNPNGPVVISGAPENVDDAKDHLLVLEEEYVSAVYYSSTWLRLGSRIRTHFVVFNRLFPDVAF